MIMHLTLRDSLLKLTPVLYVAYLCSKYVVPKDVKFCRDLFFTRRNTHGRRKNTLVIKPNSLRSYFFIGYRNEPHVHIKRNIFAELCVQCCVPLHQKFQKQKQGTGSGRASIRNGTSTLGKRHSFLLIQLCLLIEL